MVPESKVKVLADEVGLEEVGDRGPVVVGLDERRRLAVSSCVCKF